MKNIAVLGSCGSIGKQALEVIEYLGSDYRASVLASGSNAKLLAEQTRCFKPTRIAIADESKYNELKALLPDYQGEISAGCEAVCELASDNQNDLVLGAVGGIAGLLPVLSALKAKKQVALANKETLVAAGELVMELAKQTGKPILPVDSEHSAIFQCLRAGQKNLEKIVLTASGGALRNLSKEQIADVTPKQALAHPNWNMGAKITVDSATLFNKGLEVIEAHHLFNMSYDKIEVVIHPQSIIHSAITYSDGAMLAQLGLPDMKIPIQYAFTYPERTPNKLARLDLVQVGQMSFYAPDLERFPALELAYRAGKMGGTAPAVINAANEVLVAAFLQGKIKLNCLPEIVGQVLARHTNRDNPSLNDVLESDAWARQEAMGGI